MVSFKVQRLEEEKKQLLSEVYAALRDGSHEHADELRERARAIELQLDAIRREEARAKALQKAKDRSRDKVQPSAASLALSLPDSKAELNRRMQDLQDRLERARGAGELAECVEVRKAMQRVEARREELSGPPDGAHASSSSAAPPPSRSTGAASSGPLRTRAARVLSAWPSAPELPRGLGPPAQRFFTMEAELEDALDSQDMAAAQELRRRMQVFEDEIGELRKTARLRSGKLKAMKEELEQALDASEAEAAWELWRRLKVARAFHREEAPDIIPMRLTAGGRGGKGRGRGRGQQAAAGIAGDRGQQDIEEESGFGGGAGEDELLAGRKAAVQRHIEALRNEAELSDWALSMLPPAGAGEDEEERQRLEGRISELGAEIRELERALRLPDPLAASARFREVATKGS